MMQKISPAICDNIVEILIFRLEHRLKFAAIFAKNFVSGSAEFGCPGRCKKNRATAGFALHSPICCQFNRVVSRLRARLRGRL
jgi:hypothetical protein